jgi:hypothetical protein
VDWERTTARMRKLDSRRVLIIHTPRNLGPSERMNISQIHEWVFMV